MFLKMQNMRHDFDFTFVNFAAIIISKSCVFQRYPDLIHFNKLFNAPIRAGFVTSIFLKTFF